MSETNIPLTGYIRQSKLIPAIIPISKTTLWRWTRERKFPAPVHLGERVTAWRCEDVREWIAKQGAATGEAAH